MERSSVHAPDVADDGDGLGKHLRATMRSLEAIIQHVGVWYPGNRGSPVTSQNFEYDWFPPVAHGWRTMHDVPVIGPPLQAEGEGPST
jgi:hypothetical protein